MLLKPGNSARRTRFKGECGGDGCFGFTSSVGRSNSLLTPAKLACHEFHGVKHDNIELRRKLNMFQRVPERGVVSQTKYANYPEP